MRRDIRDREAKAVRMIVTTFVGVAFALAFAPATPAAPAEEPPKVYGDSEAYRILGELAVRHAGRIKPLDTQARQTVKEIYGREKVELFGPDGKPTEIWRPTAVLLDWSVRPDFWDDQEFILVEYLPLKRKIWGEAAQKLLGEIAGSSEAPAALKAEAERLGKLVETDLTAKDLRALEGMAGLSAEQKDRVEELARRLSESSKWMRPKELQQGRVLVDGKGYDFGEWLRNVRMLRGQEEQSGVVKSAALKTKAEVDQEALEREAFAAANRVSLFVAMRGRLEQRDNNGRMTLSVLPMPHDKAFVDFTAATIKKLPPGAFDGNVDSKFFSPEEGLSPFENDALEVHASFLREIARSKRKPLTEDEEFDARYEKWLQTNSGWLPLKLLLETDIGVMAGAGYSKEKVEAFRSAWDEMEKEQAEGPAGLTDATAEKLVIAARDLGESLGNYPTAEEMGRESDFNHIAPFHRAWPIYGLAVIFLTLAQVTLGVARETKSAGRLLGKSFYGLGMLAFLGGIAFEIYGFYLRVRISGWAPVTNMYETVIWVALVTSVLGFGFEVWKRQIYPALAASLIATVATILAANAPILDPDIPTLQPVLRSNYWLTIHVLTIVSSYAAFALSMGLGLIATILYLTATYRREVGYGELAKLLWIGLPLLALGSAAAYGSEQDYGPSWLAYNTTYYIACAVAIVGGMLSFGSIAAMLGEAFSRGRHLPHDIPAAPRPEESASVASEEGERPSPAEILAAVRKSSGPAAPIDGRTLAMQATAASIKPLASYIYRSMQVGVLLVAAGTILGGWWADKSWGRFWGWDPKEVWALITLLVYLIPLHGRFAGWINTFGLTASSVICFSSVVMSWYGVNFVLGVGLHSYGFGEGGGQLSVLSAMAGLLGLVLGAGYRRGRSYKPNPRA